MVKGKANWKNLIWTVIQWRRTLVGREEGTKGGTLKLGLFSTLLGLELAHLYIRK